MVRPADISPLAVNLRTSSHSALADEPERLGGKDAGPNPFDFLHFGLGSCTAITLRYYARKHDIPLDDFEVSVSSRRNEAGELIIDKQIVFDSRLAEDQIEKLTAASKRCPMHRDLQRGITIETSISIC